MRYLDALGFESVGYGCTTCIGNSGPLPDAVARRGRRGQAGGRRPCSPATATSRAGSTRRCGPTTWPRRRWSSPTRWPARCDIDLDQRAARQRQGRQAGLPQGYLADARRRSTRRCARRVTPRCSASPTPTSSPATQRWQRDRAGAGGRPTTGTTRVTYIQHAALLRGHGAGSRRRACRTSRAPASWRCSATASRPTTSRPAGNIAKTSPAGQYLIGARRRGRATSTPTAPAAATTRSWCAAPSPTSASRTSWCPAPRAA